MVLVVGLALLQPGSRVGKALIRASYDWSLDLALNERPSIRNSDVAIIYLDEASHRVLKQPLDKPWDRELHARLVDRLSEDRARAVVFNIVLSELGSNLKADKALADAMARNGKVLLGAQVSYSDSMSGEEAAVERTLTRPNELFRNAAAGWGFAMLEREPDFTVRKHEHDSAEFRTPGQKRYSLSWSAAKLVGLGVTKAPGAEKKERWVNYYGPPETVPSVSYAKALAPGGLSKGFFQNKIVFIAARPNAGSYNERRDDLRSPYSATQPEFQFMPAVEVHATQFLNLERTDWLSRLPLEAEGGVLVIVAVLFGFGLFWFRPLPATGMAVVGVLASLLGALVVSGRVNVWFPWLIIVAAQIPLALLWCIVFKSVDWYVQKRRMEQERKRAELQIREQAALLDKAQDAIIVHDLEWQASFWNKSAERLYGWTAREVLQQNLANFILNGDVGRLEAAKVAVLENEEWVGELKQKTKTGTHIIVQSRWSLVRDANGAPQSILVINTDITEKKQLETQFLRAQRMESIGTLAGGIAHDLNNVLAPIVMGVELLRSRVPDEQCQNVLRTMAGSARRGAEMVKQVLTFARGQEGERSALQLSQPIGEMQKIIRETFPKSIELEIDIEERLWPIFGDATQWHQVLLNLCVNARDAMDQGGKISIAACNVILAATEVKRLLGANPGKHVRLRVSDTGKGMPPEVQDKIFEPFFTTKEVGKGTGLGLSTVSSIVKSHGAILELSSEVGKGTVFTIYIPALQLAAESKNIEAPSGKPLGQGETILIVDDEPGILEVMKCVLSDQGYRVLTAFHGVDAVAVCSQRKEERIDLAFVDMMMPVMDGPRTIRALQSMRPELRFIAMSGLHQGNRIKDQLGEQVVTFLPKPISSEDLLRALKRAFPEKSAGETVCN